MVFVMQGYPDLLISTLVSLKLTSKLDIILTSFNDSLAFFMSGFFGFYVITLPLFLQSKLNRKFMFLDVESSKETSEEYKALMAMEERIYDTKWDCLYSDFRKDKWAMMHNYFFIMRRMIFVFAVVYLDVPALQIIILVLSN